MSAASFLSAEIAEAALKVLLQASSALQPADLSATLTHSARLDMKEDIRNFARTFTAQTRTAVNPAVPALAAMLSDNQDLAHACFEASGEGDHVGMLRMTWSEWHVQA